MSEKDKENTTTEPKQKKPKKSKTVKESKSLKKDKTIEKKSEKVQKNQSKEEPVIVEVKEEFTETVEEIVPKDQKQEEKSTGVVEEKNQEESKKEEKKKKTCNKCKTQNDEDANFCKNCGKKLKTKITKENVLYSISYLLQIISIAVALDAMVQVRPHVGSTRGDNIVIEYAFLLATCLLLSTVFRLLGNNVTPKKIIKNKFNMSEQTTKEVRLITAVYVLAMFLFIYSNSRIVFLKPGNNYIDKKIEQYVKRWDGVESYSRIGYNKCPRVNWYWKYLPDYTFFCYEYTYVIKFEDGKSCFIKYRTRHTSKVDNEAFSYCDKK